MAQTKNARYRVHNGVDFDTIHLETSAKQVKMADGSTVEKKIMSHLADFESLIAGGQSFTAVLEKGWNGDLYYSKNDLGLVHVRGILTVGTVSVVTQIATLPGAYIPKQSQALGVLGVDTSVYSGVVVNQYSQVQIRKPATDNIKNGDHVYINVIYQS